MKKIAGMILTRGKREPAQGYAATVAGVDVMVSRSRHDRPGRPDWRVTELVTGCRIGRGGATRQAAVAAAEELVADRGGPAALASAIAAATEPRAVA